MPEFKVTLRIYNIFNLLLLACLFFPKGIIPSWVIVIWLGIDLVLCGGLGMFYKRILFTKTPPLEYDSSFIARGFNSVIIIIGLIITVIGVILLINQFV